MLTLAQAIAALTPVAESFAIDAPEEWAQGRTLFGGMTAALSHGAILRAEGGQEPLRSAQFTFIGPATGRLSFRPELLRRGRSSTVIGVDCRNEDGLAARSTFVFGGARETLVVHDHVMCPDVPQPDDCPPFSRSSKPPQGFLGRFETRLAAGSRILEPDNKPEFAVWVRLHDETDVDPVTALLALTDSLPCAAWVAFPKPGPVSTMTWTVDFHQPLQESGGWHLIRSSSERAAEGYSLQDMRVFNRGGEPLISARQVVAIFV